MKRFSYHQKRSSINNKATHNKSKIELDLDILHLQMAKIPHNVQSNFMTSSRPNRYSYISKGQGQKLSSGNSVRRPYTSLKNNSFNNDHKKQSHLHERKPYSSVGKHSKNNDLLVFSLKDNSQSNVNNTNYKNLQNINNNKGKLHRGISFKGQQKSFIKDNSNENRPSSRQNYNYSPYNQNVSYTTRQPIRESSSNKRPAIIDLIGKNLKNSLFNQSYCPQKDNTNDNFFQYVMRFSYKTKKGYAPNNPHKINQDSYITHPNINGKTWQHLFGICDGHGPLGHLVSSYVKNTLPQCIGNIKNLDKNPIFSLNKGFQHCYQKMIKQSHIDMNFSGSTVIVCYFIQNKIYCCNVGDSRAILGRCMNQQSKNWTSIQLSTDHKPSIVSQAQRIKKMKGRVQAYKDQFGQQIGPLRVWLKHDNAPGLAMTRSFGDLVGASVGVSHIPQIKQFTLCQDDKILLIGSDGVFQFLSNEQIIKQLTPFYHKKKIQQASDHLLNIAHRSWSRNSSIVDDITFILIFMHYNQI